MYPFYKRASANYYRGMQDCFRQHPEIYGSELADDEGEVEDELRAEAAAREAGQSAASASSAEITMPQAPRSTPQVEAVEQEPAKDVLTGLTRTEGDGGEAKRLVPKSQHGPTSA
jgi:intermembrane space import and assembly protein 40